METARISEYRSQLSNYHKGVLEDHEPLRIVGGSRGDVVILPAEDYERLQETIGILKDKATLNSLLETRAEFHNGNVIGQSIEEAFSDVLESTNQ